MRFSAATVSAALFGAALAAPVAQRDAVPRDNIIIKNFKSTTKDLSDNSPVVSVEFQIVSQRKEGVKAYVCSASNPNGLSPADFNKCANFDQNDGYRFYVVGTRVGNTSLLVFHQTGEAAGVWGNVFVSGLCGSDGEHEVCGRDSVNAGLGVF